jgi:hypothetical protein
LEKITLLFIITIGLSFQEATQRSSMVLSLAGVANASVEQVKSENQK